MRDKPEILVVDDDQDFAASLAELIREQDCNVTLASSSMDALTLFDCQPFDLVFLDLKMPGISGIECFFKLRKRHPDALVIITTGFCDDRELQKAFNNGLYAVLGKPVDIDHLNIILSNLRTNPVILVADDDAVCSHVVSGMLKGKGYRVSMAKDGKEALDKALQGNIGLMILDLYMPVLNGYQVCQRLKEAGSSLPVIFTTAYPDSKLMKNNTLENFAIDACMMKPIQPERLYKTIDAALLAHKYKGNLNGTCD